MKYRIYRKLSRIQYKDIDCKTIKQAERQHISVDNFEWKTITNGLISDWIVTKDFSKENDQVFIERDIELMHVELAKIQKENKEMSQKLKENL